MILPTINDFKVIPNEGPLIKTGLEKVLKDYQALACKTYITNITISELTYDFYTKTKVCNRNDTRIYILFLTEFDQLAEVENKLLQNIARKYIYYPVKVLFIKVKEYKFIWSSFYEADVNIEIIILKGQRRKYIGIKAVMKSQENIIRVIDTVLSGSGEFRILKRVLELNELKNETMNF